MEPVGRFPRVINGVPREYILGSPRDFLKANPRPHLRPDPGPKTRGAVGHEGFWPRVWPRMQPRVCQKIIPRGTFNILPWNSIEFSRDLPKGLHSPFFLNPSPAY